MGTQLEKDIIGRETSLLAALEPEHIFSLRNWVLEHTLGLFALHCIALRLDKDVL